MCRSGTEPRSGSKARSAAPPTPRLIAAAVAAAVLGASLGGCSEMYFDHREGVTLGAGDAVAANAAMQTIDPWPARSRNTNIATNGQRMQSAIERYRTNNVTQPVDPMQIEFRQPGAADAASHAAHNGAGAKHRVGVFHDNDRCLLSAAAGVAVIPLSTRQV